MATWVAGLFIYVPEEYSTQHHHLQCNYQLLWEGSSLAAGVVFSGGHAAKWHFSRRDHLQCNHQRLWKGWAMATSPGNLRCHAPGWHWSRHFHLQCNHQCLCQNRIVGNHGFPAWGHGNFFNIPGRQKLQWSDQWISGVFHVVALYGYVGFYAESQRSAQHD